MAGANGGAFLLAYLFFVVIVGVPVEVAELSLSRRGQGDAKNAFSAIAPRSAWIAPELIGVAAAFLVLTFYAVISGWALKYFVGAASGLLWDAAAWRQVHDGAALT